MIFKIRKPPLNGIIQIDILVHLSINFLLVSNKRQNGYHDQTIFTLWDGF